MQRKRIVTSCKGRRPLADCILRCASVTDGRARWPAQQRCAAALAGPGAEPSAIDQACAAAARRVGEALAALLPAKAGA